MEEFTVEQLLKIRASFCEPIYTRPHGEIVVTQLVAAMIASGKFEIPDYPRLVEEAIKLNALLVTRFETEWKREVEKATSPNPPASEQGNSDDSEDYDRIPF